MTEKEIKTTRKNLITPIVVYIILFLVAVSFNIFGSKTSILENVSIFASVYSLTFIIFYGIKLYNFNKFIKNN